jgi:hypothetical protein
VLVRVRNDQPYLGIQTDRLPVAVTAAAPFRLELEPVAAPLVQNSPLQLQVRLERDKGFNGQVRVRMVWDPPGVRSGAATIAPNQREAQLALSANGNAPEGTWQIAVHGFANVGGLLVQSSGFVELKVAAPWMTAAIDSVRCEPGSQVVLPIKLERKKPFTGEFVPEILNLPEGVKVAWPTLDQDATEFQLTLEVSPQARPGRHRNLLLALRIPSESGTALHYLYGGELRIDKPLPSKDPKAQDRSKENR